MRDTVAIAALTLVVGACHDNASPAEPVPAAPTGSIRITAAMSGVDVPSRFSVRWLAGTVTSDAYNEARLEHVATGSWWVELVVASNCRVEGQNPRTVTVVADQSVMVPFSVTCVSATGYLRVSVASSGVDLDRTGFFINARGLAPNDEPYNQTEPIAVNATVVFAVSVGATTVWLWDVALNCVAHDANPQTTVIRSQDTTNVVFSVECSRKAELAYVGPTGNGDIYLVAEDGSDVRQLTFGEAVDADPAWSPDGQTLAFTSDRDGDRELYRMNASGGDIRRLTNAPTPDYQPSWSPDGRKIAFVSERWGDAEIFVIDADGSDLMRLTGSPGDDYAPAWSPDGGRIAFTTRREGKPRIYVMNADGSDTRPLSPGEGEYPSWAPGGYTIAYSGIECSDYYPGICYPAVFIPPTVGSSFVGTRPSWSRNGWKVAFNGLDCDASFRCLPGWFRIARLDRRDNVVAITPGSSPTWRPR